MSQSRRSSRRALHALGSGGSVHRFSALPVAARRLPSAPQLSKRAKQRLRWLDDRRTHTTGETCRPFALPRSTLNRWATRFAPRDLTTREDRPARPQTARQRT